MSNFDAVNNATSTSQCSSPSVAELFHAAGIVTPRQAGSPHVRPYRRSVVPLVTVLLLVLGIVAAINLG